MQELSKEHSAPSAGDAVPGTKAVVRLSAAREGPDGLDPLFQAVSASAGNVPALLGLAQEAGKEWPRPGEGNTALLWELLATVAALDVAAARVFEPHLDALAILAQAGHDPARASGAWGVFAAEGPGMRLAAESNGSGVLLSGAKPWCSLAQVLDHAVVTAHTDDGGRAAFAVDLRHAGVTCEEPEWVARGLQEIPSGTVRFDRVPAEPLQGTNWYFSRPGFAWGGMGVAACWLGGAVGIARDYRDSLRAGRLSGREPDQVALASLGELDRTLTSALQYLAGTAEGIDRQGQASTEQVSTEQVPADQGSPQQWNPGRVTPWSDALRVRATCAAAVERVMSVVGSNRGPGPLAFDRTYAKRMADLALYVRQHHGMRDDAQLGSLTLKGDAPW
ncbi:acyl-CoA dehydrogenase family protein [Pseudarthrobacter polychromogenes]|uniref:Acyl-CoA dehydrogenase n=1 Tax=Pseudarthrobacter polychromogenes TaxID=1676 RepID=A0ABQ1XJG3_9MICC|nr:acyl-CoA dehydrogenase family protein [Pseudarthrobacter polychromogenes]GGG95285.1 acyl-CoA dehydrogenase [Pseudarthrobacter polychromogenes]